MKQRLLKWVSARLVAAVALALPFAAFAAPTATAVWRSNLGQSYTIGGNTYGVTIPGNETKQAGVLNADGTITVANEWTGFSSPYIGLSSANPTAVSMLVKFSGLSIPESDATGVCLAAMRDSSGNEVGAVVKASSTSLKAYYMGNTATTTTEGDVTGGENVVTQSGYMLFSYSTTGGVKIYVGSDVASLAGGAMGSYKYGNNTIERFSIGGDPAGKVYTPSGMIIEEVALFVGSALTNTDVADYAFPTLDGETTALTMTELNTKIAADSNVIFTASPVVTLDVEPSDATKTYLQSAVWNGTVFIKDADKNNIVPTAYGNPNSTLKLSGVKGYFAKAKYDVSSTPVIELEDSGTEGRVYGLWNYDGYSFNSYSGYPYVHTPELKGSGSLVADKSGALKTLIVVDKWSAFTGKLQLAPSGIVCFGTGLPEQTDASSAALTAGSIRLSGTVPATIGTWTVGTAFTGSVVTLTTAANATTTAFLTDSTKWKGTCQLNWNHTSALDIVNYGNANSVVEIVSTFSAYPTQNGGNAAANLAAELKLSANWTVANGWDSKTTTFAKLSGTGNLIVNGTSSSTNALPYTITKIENFTGALGGARGQFTIGTIVSSVEPVGGTKLVSLSNCTKTPVLTNTTVEYNGAAVEGIALEVKSDGIYVAVPATTVDITIPEIANATVSVTADGVAVTPENGVVTVNIGAAVVVTYTAAEGYQLTGDAISFTASASTTTVDVSNVSVAAIVANVTSADGQTTTPYTSAASAIATADDGETVTLLETTVTLTEVVAINKSITIMSGNASGTTITGSGLSAYPTLGAADLTIGANVTFAAQMRVLSGEATITHPTGSAPSYRPPSGYMSSSKNNGDDTTTITFYQQVYVVAAGTNATFADESGNQLGSFTPVASGDTFVFTVTPAEGCALVRVTADGVELTPSEGKYSISIGSSNVAIYAIAGAAVVTGGDSDEYYSSLQAAIDAAATDGQTVKLLANVALDSTVVVDNSLTFDLNGMTVTGPAGGYVFSNAGSVVITGEGAVTSAGGIVTNTASGASVVISNGTYTVTGDLFGNVEGGEIAVSGGTFSAPLDDDYCAEGYEPADLGNSTYGVRIDKGWIYEDKDFPNYTGSWTTQVEYGADNKITLDSDNTYTANKPSDGRFVTLNVKASFDDVNDDNSEIAGAKAAVRLAAGDIEGSYVFQLYMATNNIPGCWVNVGASVEATTNTDYTFTLVLDMTNRTYTAQVNGEFLGLITDNAITNFYFATAAATDVVQTLDFRGSGTVTSITGSYENPEAPAQEFTENQEIGSVTLTARQATWLNGQNNYAELAAKIATMDATAFNNAYLLNLDILDEEYDGTYSFTVTEITFGPYEFEGDPDPVTVEAVTIKVELVRKGALDGGINGRLSLKGGNSLPASGFETISEVLINDETFKDGNVATIVFEKDDEHAAAFYQPVILPIVE